MRVLDVLLQIAVLISWGIAPWAGGWRLLLTTIPAVLAALLIGRVANEIEKAAVNK